MKRPLWLVLLLCAPALADDPPKPVVPVAAIVVPKVQPLVVFADGTTTKTAATWQAVDPADAELRVEGGAAMVLNPTPGTAYTLALVATGDSPPFALRLVKIVAPGATPTPAPDPKPAPPSPAPGPPAPVNPPVVTPPSPATTDRFGLTASTRAVLAGRSWGADSLKFRQETIGKLWSDAATAAATSADPQSVLAALEVAYKAACGSAWDGENGWQATVFAPLRANLLAVKVATGADLAECLNEVAAAMKEAPIARR